jgi:hypothetical protein
MLKEHQELAPPVRPHTLLSLPLPAWTPHPRTTADSINSSESEGSRGWWRCEAEQKVKWGPEGDFVNWLGHGMSRSEYGIKLLSLFIFPTLSRLLLLFLYESSFLNSQSWWHWLALLSLAFSLMRKSFLAFVMNKSRFFPLPLKPHLLPPVMCDI